MATYKYKDVERALLACGFKPQKNNNGSHQIYVDEKNNNGSHQIYVDEKTGFAQPLPKHSNGVIAPGTADSILNYAVMVARLKNINICSDRYKLSNDVIDYIKKQHSKVKQNLMFLIPDAIKKQLGLKQPSDIKKFLKSFFEKSKLKKSEPELSY